MRDLYARFGGGLATIFLSLVLIWLAAMVLAPNLMMIDYALRPNLPPPRSGPRPMPGRWTISFIWRTKGCIARSSSRPSGQAPWSRR
ncbi:hypothetical protein ACFSYD_01110 [Paracoccus aerius]